MGFDFEKQPLRTASSLKAFMTDAAVAAAGHTSFGPAELDFPTAPCVVESVARMVQNGLYGFTIKSKEYLEHIRWWMAAARGWDISTDWVVPTMGTIFSVATAIRMATEPGQGVIVQPPVYYRYEQAARRLGRKTVYNNLRLDGGRYEMDFDDLERQMADPQNRLLVLCNPCNPIGRVWSEQELGEVARLSRKYGVYVLSDEIFAEVTFDGRKTTPYAAIDEGRARAITSTSLGKTFNFTGVNHANLIIPDEELRRCFSQQRDRDHYGSLEPFVEAAVLGAYTPDGLEWVKAMRAYVAENADLVKGFFARNSGWGRVFPIEGTFVAWIEWKGPAAAGAETPAELLLKRALFQTEPGEEYGAGCRMMTRMNLGAQHSETAAALSRVSHALRSLEGGQL